MNITNLHPQYLKGLVDGIGFTLKFQNKVRPIIFNASVAFFRLMNKFGISFLFLICITLPGFSIQRQECYLFEKANHICELKEKQQHIENLKNEITGYERELDYAQRSFRSEYSDWSMDLEEHSIKKIKELNEYLPNI